MVLIGQYPLNADMFDGTSHIGPVPTYFAPDPRAARQNLQTNPAGAHADIRKLNSFFLQMEHMTVSDASAFLAKKYKPAAKGRPIYADGPAYTGMPDPKRARVGDHGRSLHETGNNNVSLQKIAL